MRITGLIIAAILLITITFSAGCGRKTPPVYTEKGLADRAGKTD